MIQELLGSFQPLAIIALLVVGVIALKLSWLLISALIKLSVLMGVLWLAIEMIPASQSNSFGKVVGKQLRTTINQLADAKDLVSDQLSRYEVRFVVRDKKSTAEDRQRSISRF